MKVKFEIKKCGDGFMIGYDENTPQEFGWDLAGIFNTKEECRDAINKAINNYKKPEIVEETIIKEI